MGDINAVKAKIQAEALARWKAAGKKGLLAMGTGTGKTKVALDRVAELHLETSHAEMPHSPRVLLVVPTEKLRDENWPEEAHKWGMTTQYLTYVEGYCYASLSKKPSGHYDLVILDEAHRITDLGAIGLDAITYDELMALSATPPKDEEKKRLLDRIAPTVFTYSIDQGVEDGVVADYTVVVVEVPPDSKDKYIAGGSKAKPFKQTEASRYAYINKQIEPLQIQLRELQKQIYAQILVHEATGDDTELDKLRREKQKLEPRVQRLISQRMHLIYGLKAKTELAKKVLVKVMPGTRGIVFAGSIKQAEELMKETFHSKTTDEYLTAFKAEKIPWIAVVNALNEGHNVPNVDVGVVVQLSSNERDLIQRIGRIIRYREGHKGVIYILVAAGTQDEKWAKKALESIDPSRIIYLSHNNF